MTCEASLPEANSQKPQLKIVYRFEKYRIEIAGHTCCKITAYALYTPRVLAIL